MRRLHVAPVVLALLLCSPSPPAFAGAEVIGSVKTVSGDAAVLRDGQPVPVAVTIGQTNGRQTEIAGGEVREAMQVITDAVSARQ